MTKKRDRRGQAGGGGAIAEGQSNDLFSAESHGDSDSMMFFENLPPTMSFTSKRTQDAVINWLCMDQNTTAEKILRCF